MITNAELIIDINKTQTYQNDPIVFIVFIALLSAIIANTLIAVKHYENYKWWYGLIKVIAYFGMFALTLSSAGLSAALASVSTYLGMELNTLLRRLSDLGILSGFLHAIRGSRKDKASKVTSERQASRQ
jgi:L-asparagine transporter-like permease